MIALRALRSLSSTSSPRFLFRRQLHRVSNEVKRSEDEVTSIHPTAVVHRDAVIGKGVVIGPFCTVGSDVIIGNACQLQPASHVMGDTRLGDRCTIHTKRMRVSYTLAIIMILESMYLFTGHLNQVTKRLSVTTILSWVYVILPMTAKLDHTHTAGAIVVHQFCHIGSYSFIGGGSVITQDVPKYMMVSGDRAELRGLNLEGLRRNGFSSMEVRNMRKAYQKIFMPSDANSRGFENRLSEVEENEELANSPVVRSMLKSIRESSEQSRRGICKFRQWSGA